MTGADSSLETPTDLEDELHALLRRAQMNGIDVAGAWECQNGDGNSDWDIVVTEVKRSEPTD